MPFIFNKNKTVWDPIHWSPIWTLSLTKVSVGVFILFFYVQPISWKNYPYLYHLMKMNDY